MLHNHAVAVLSQQSFPVVYVAASNSSAADKSIANYTCDGTNDEVEGQVALTAVSLHGGKVVFLPGAYSKGDAGGMVVSSNTTIENQGTWTLASGINTDAFIFANANKTNGNSRIKIIGGIYDLNYLNNTPATYYQALCDFENAGYYVNAYITNFTMLEVKAKNCSGRVVNTKFQQVEVILAPCEATNEWTVSADGTISLDTTDFVVGSGSIKCAIPNTGTKRINLIKNISNAVSANFEAYDAVFWIKFEDISKVSHLSLIGANPGSLSGDNIYNPFDAANLNYMFTSGEWYQVRAPLNRYVAAASPYTPYFHFQFIVTDATNILIDDLRLIPVTCDPAITFEYDDARTEALPGISIMDSYGHKGCVGQMGPDAITGIAMTIAQLDVVSALGWDITSHFGTHIHLITEAEFEANIESGLAFLESHGWAGKQFWTFPGNDSNSVALDYVESRFTACRKPFIGVYNYSSMRYANGRPQSVRQPCTPNTVVNEAEKAMLRHHGWVIHYTHGIDDGKTDFEFTETECIAWSEFWRDWGLLSRPPSAIIS